MNPLATFREWSKERRISAAIRTLNTESRSLTYGPGGYVPASPILSGTFVTPETALGVAAVYSAINRISTDIAVLPRAVYRRLPGAGREIERTGELGELNDMLSVQPNSDNNALRFMQDSMGHVLGRGNAFWEIVRKRGFPVSLELLHPSKTLVKRTERGEGRAGRLYYELENHNRISPDDIVHLSGFGFNGLIGYSPVTIARQTIGLSMGADQHGASYFGNSARPGGWIKTAKKLSQAAVDNLRRTYNQVHQGSQSAHMVGILEEGMEWVENAFSLEDGQFLATREFQVKDIARIFSIPPHKIGDLSESHLANVEEMNIDYVAMTLLGWVIMLESEWNVKLLTREQRQTHEIGINMSGLLRGNIANRMLKAQTMRNTGAWSADDIRIAEGENPLPAGVGGDKYVIQAQYVPLDQVGKMPVSPPKPGEKEKKDRLFESLNRIEARLNHENGVAA